MAPGGPDGPIRMMPAELSTLVGDLGPMPLAGIIASALPAEILGRVYEHLLTREIRLGPGRAVSFAKQPAVRKASGVFYTPPELVRYIVASALAPVTSGQVPDLGAGASAPTCLDPACGAGVFLLGAFRYLCDWHVEHYRHYRRADADERARSLWRDGDGRWRLRFAERQRILRRHIHGVDIDPVAVEVTKLSLALALFDPADGPVARDPSTLAQVLGALGRNIQCGDSLIPGLAADRRAAGFSWHRAFPEIMDAGGFDAVVGNPPYLNLDEAWGRNDPRIGYLKEHYAEIYNDKTDVLYYFLYLAVRLARCRVAMIVSRSFLEAYKADKLRGWLAEHTRVVEIIDFRNFAAFPGIEIATAIVHFDNGAARAPARVRTLRRGSFALAQLADERALAGCFDEVRVEAARFSSNSWLFAGADLRQTLDRIDACGQPAGAVLHVGQGMQTGRNRAFTIATQAASGLAGAGVRHFARARNSDIRAFRITDRGEALLYLEDGDRFDELPLAVQAHLRGFEDELRARAAHRRGSCRWWQYTWPLHREYIDAPRILCPYLARENRFALDREARFLGLSDTTVLYRGDHREALEYFVGVLNTRMMTVRLRYLAKFKGNDIWEYFENTVARLPLRRIDFADRDEVAAHDAIVALVREIEQRTTAVQSALVDERRADLEAAVRRLYGLDGADSRNLDGAAAEISTGVIPART